MFSVRSFSKLPVTQGFTASLGRRFSNVMFKVRIGDETATVKGAVGESVLEACEREGIPLSSHCGGNQICGGCHCVVEDGDINLFKAPDEKERLRLKKLKKSTPQSRLACGLEITNALENVTLTHFDSQNETRVLTKSQQKEKKGRQDAKKSGTIIVPFTIPKEATYLKPVAPGAFWVGALDYTVRDFHGYLTPNGSSYNAYVVKCGSEHVLIDTVKEPFANEVLANIAQITDKLDWIVINHAEPDHSSSLPVIMKAFPQANVITNKTCAKFLKKHYNTNGWNWQIVKDGESKKIGDEMFIFRTTPMAHWPDSMMTYQYTPETLFSMDAFGQHVASAGRFDFDFDMHPEGLMGEAKTYYANILQPLSKAVGKAIDKLHGVPLTTVCTAHGAIWTKSIPQILEAYGDWVANKLQPKVVVAYDTMWKSTEVMARALARGVTEGGAAVKLMNLHSSNTHITELATETMDAAAWAFGSATLNSGMLPDMAGALCYLKGLHPPGVKRDCLTFGSYGWEGDVVPHQLSEALEMIECTPISRPLGAQFRPDEACLRKCYAAGQNLAKKAIERALHN